MKTRTTYCDTCDRIRSHRIEIECHPDHDDLCRAFMRCCDCHELTEFDERENAFDWEHLIADLRWPGDTARQMAYHHERRKAQWMTMILWTDEEMGAIFEIYRYGDRALTQEEVDRYARMRRLHEYCHVKYSGVGVR